MTKYKKDTKPDLLAVMQESKVEMKLRAGARTITARCPFHKDTGRPNLVVWASSGTWRCFRCNFGGDVYDFVGHTVYGTAWDPRNREMFLEVLRRLGEQEIPDVEYKPLPPPEPPKGVVVQVLGLAARVYHLSLMSKKGRGSEIRTLLAKRGIDIPAIRKLQIGWAEPGVLASILASYPPGVKEAAQNAGLFYDGREWLAGRITFPDVAKGGAVHHMIGRHPDREAKLRYLSLPGLPKTIWGLGNITRNQPVIITESIIDAVNMRQMGLQGVASNGTGIAWYLMATIAKVQMLAILPQGDEAGQEAVQKWVQEVMPNARVLSIPYGTKANGKPQKDLNDIVEKSGMEVARGTLLSALKEVGMEVGGRAQ